MMQYLRIVQQFSLSNDYMLTNFFVGGSYNNCFGNFEATQFQKKTFQNKFSFIISVSLPSGGFYIFASEIKEK